MSAGRNRALTLADQSPSWRPSAHEDEGKAGQVFKSPRIFQDQQDVSGTATSVRPRRLRRTGLVASLQGLSPETDDHDPMTMHHMQRVVGARRNIRTDAMQGPWPAAPQPPGFRSDAQTTALRSDDDFFRDSMSVLIQVTRLQSHAAASRSKIGKQPPESPPLHGILALDGIPYFRWFAPAILMGPLLWPDDRAGLAAWARPGHPDPTNRTAM